MRRYEMSTASKSPDGSRSVLTSFSLVEGVSPSLVGLLAAAILRDPSIPEEADPSIPEENHRSYDHVTG
jgi:hypothetical protein